MRTSDEFKEWYQKELTDYISENPSQEFWAEEAMLNLHRIVPPWDEDNPNGAIDIVKIWDLMDSLVKGIPLTPLLSKVDKPDEWEETDDPDIFINKRYPNLLAIHGVLDDGEVFYEDDDRFEYVDIMSHRKASVQCVHLQIRHILNSLFPIKMPYLPKIRKDIVYLNFIQMDDSEDRYIIINNIFNPENGNLSNKLELVFRIDDDGCKLIPKEDFFKKLRKE